LALLQQTRDLAALTDPAQRGFPRSGLGLWSVVPFYIGLEVCLEMGVSIGMGFPLDSHENGDGDGDGNWIWMWMGMVTQQHGSGNG